MRTWIFASICTLILSLLSAYCFNGEDWSAFDYFTATCLFGIFLKLKDQA